MRNPERIDIICGLLAEVWTKYPDLRLGQLLENCCIFPVKRYSEVTVFPEYGIKPASCMYPFGQEDDETERRLRELI